MLSEDDEYTTDQSKSWEGEPYQGLKVFNVTDYESEFESDDEGSKLHNVDKFS